MSSSERKGESFADLFARGDVPIAKARRLSVGDEIEGVVGHMGPDSVFVDIDEVVPGIVDEETGAVTFAEQDDAVTYGVVDEIARRVWRTGGRVLAVRRGDIPGGGSAAAILRYPV